jgi:hypothetical protein
MLVNVKPLHFRLGTIWFLAADPLSGVPRWIGRIQAGKLSRCSRICGELS